MKLAEIGNICIRIYPDDTRKHKRPHFHAVGPDTNAVFALPEMDIIAGSFSRTERDQVLAWAALNMDHLIETWNQLNPRIPVRPP
ncbi:MAG: DUF4160 domain-containing protein [Azospirillum sp.]|nr:DUF4160 domain-containing protein [Azospirillum sp.]